MKKNIETLDDKLDKQIERYFGHLLEMYNRKIRRARDKAYVRIKYKESLSKIFKEQINENDFGDYFEIISIMNDSYNVGTPINKAIKIVRKAIWTPNDIEIEIMYNHKNTIITNPNPTPRTRTKYHQYIDSEILWLFARHKAYTKFYTFIQNEIKIDKGELVSIESNKDEKDNENSTIRQVLFMQFIFQELGVYNSDKTIQRNIIKFLTNKNDDNIYNRLRNPYSFTNKTNRDNLRYVRSYFEDLGLQSIINKINKEINYDE